MSVEKLTKEEYDYIMFESIIRALAAMEEMFRKCKIEPVENEKYHIIKQRLYRTAIEILK